MFATDFSLNPAELARAVEGVGLDSLWLPEHTHMPLNHGQYPSGGPLPKTYSHSLDPFVGLARRRGGHQTLKLGTGVCLVTEHDPITLAKQVASLDHLSSGRFLFGIGAGWNREEMRNHGTNPRLRWRVLRERIQAMKAIWTQDEAEYHGELVDFDPLWSWPKPIQRPHPPIMMGGDGPKAIEGVLDYCDEWMPHPERTDRTLAERIADLQARAAAANRPAAAGHGVRSRWRSRADRTLPGRRCPGLRAPPAISARPTTCSRSSSATASWSRASASGMSGEGSSPPTTYAPPSSRRPRGWYRCPRRSC